LNSNLAGLNRHGLMARREHLQAEGQKLSGVVGLESTAAGAVFLGLLRDNLAHAVALYKFIDPTSTHASQMLATLQQRERDYSEMVDMIANSKKLIRDIGAEVDEIDRLLSGKRENFFTPDGHTC